jgi:hypothetical protein
MAASERDQAICDWIDLIVKESLPMTTVEKTIFRQFSKHNVNISSKALKEIMFTLVELVEQEIDKEMAAAGCGATMHDAWTKFSVHYMAMFATYMRKVKVVESGIHIMCEVPTCTPLSVAPMAQVDENGDLTEANA